MEVPCDPGTFSNVTGLGGSLCPPCAPGTFQSLFGGDSCAVCPSSATSATGATTCTCIGLNRVFQPSDMSCVCAPGYVYVNAAFQQMSQSDGVEACQPIVLPFCATGSTRAADGTCVSDAVCASCPSGSGMLISSTGLCECNQQASLSEVCDATCRATAPTVTVDPAANGSLLVSQLDPATGDVTTVSVTVGGLLAALTCSAAVAVGSNAQLSGVIASGSASLAAAANLTSCKLVNMELLGSGVAASYDLPSSVQAALSAGNGSRRLGATPAAALYSSWRRRYSVDRALSGRVLSTVRPPPPS